MVRVARKKGTKKGDAPEWHLLNLLGMAILLDLGSGDLAWCGEQWVAFGSSLDGARLDAAKAIADALLGDQQQEALELVAVSGSLMIPGDTELHGMFEAELSCKKIGVNALPYRMGVLASRHVPSAASGIRRRVVSRHRARQCTR
ncbi:MAG: hypothetical protein HYY78_02215 [Betaproteobacteria bacterium]|nr:hypothetical protein [Betaproteobacteria bacterium]